MIRSTEDAVQAVQEAVRTGKRIAVRGGGHCVEDFMDSSDIEVLLDMSTYDEVASSRVVYGRPGDGRGVDA